MHCPRCGKSLREGTRFCTACGHATAGNEAETEADRARRTVAGGAVAADRLVGHVLDRKYEIVERLGRGGMGAVYRARRLHIGDEVAVKVLHEGGLLDETSAERFRREARSAASIVHPNVVTIHDFCEARGADAPAYIVMELVRGPSLRALLQREGRLAAGRAVGLMRDICAGVGQAHRKGVVHRDLKPDNVIIVPPVSDGEPEVAKVVDFGIAKLRDADSQLTLTRTGAVVGTPFYMSPEQCNGASLDARADVYALGAILYEMLTGAPPFRADNLAALVAKHLDEPPPPFPPELGVSPALADVCLRALSKRPEQRQADASELARELRDVAPAPAHAGSQPPFHLSHLPTARVERFGAPPVKSRRPLWWAVGGVLLLLVCGALAVPLFWYAGGWGGGANITSNDSRRADAPTPTPTAGDAEGSGAVAEGPAVPPGLGGEWEGPYGPLGTRTSLAIKEGAGGKFTGVLTQGAVRVEFTGTVDASTRRVTFKETRLLSGSDWSLGENTGTLSADGKTMTGTGRDSMGAQLGLSYSWSFSRR